MPKDDKNEFLKALNVDSFASENEIRKAYKKLALQCHPDKNFSETTAKKQFEELSKAFENLVLLDEANNSMYDSDQIFFDFLGEILFGSESNSDFFSFFCGSKQHCCQLSDGDLDHRYQDDYDEEDIDGESELDSIMEIVKNRRKKGKSVPDNFHEGKLQELKTMLAQHKEDMKKDCTKKQQTTKKGKTAVPVAKPKPKSKKQLLAEQRRRDKEMQQIAMQLEEKRKEDEEKDKQRKQMEIERQKRLEEERIKAQNEERKRREREQKEREKQQRQEQEKEERKRRQQEEEKKRKEEEEKRKKAEKEKGAKKAALQAAKEKEEQAKAASKLQSAKRQPQQQRTDQQQYPREIPPRFQKMKKQQLQQQQQQHMQQSQSTSYQPNQQSTQQQQQQQQPQQNRAQIKPQPPVGKKKDPNRFASKEYAGLINEVDDLSWPKGQAKGSGWVGSTEDWEQETDKWGAVDRDWGGKEGTTWQNVVDRTDSNTWPAVGSKTTNDTTTTNTSNITISKPTSANSNALLQTDSKSRNVFSSNTVNSQQTKNWNAPSSSTGLDTWDSACDDSIDRALDAADSKQGVAGAAGGVGWGGMGTGGLGGLIGTPLSWDPAAAVSSKSDTPSNGKQGWTGNSTTAGLDSSWSKTPGKGPKIKPTNELENKKPNVTNTSTWGGTPADTSSAWVEHSKKAEKSATWDTDTNSSNFQPSSSGKTSSESTDKLKARTESTGWGESAVSWGKAPDIAGTACWDNALNARKVTESRDVAQSKGWLENAATSSNASTADKEEASEGSWDGWTTASKRNRAPKPAPPPTNSTDSNAWMSRSLKQLLDMGFKQEDADKALRANHMNIESAIGDLLSMTAGSTDSTTSNASTTSTSKDQEASTDSNSFQQQPQLKQNRKQRRKIQQQQQQQLQQNSLPTSEESQVSTEASKQSATSTTTTSTVPQTLNIETNTKAPVNKAVKPSVKPNAPQQPVDKPKVSPTADQPNPQAPKPVGAAGLQGTNAKRGATGLMQPPTPGVPTPLRTPMSHPLLQQQLMQQYHLMRMGGLLQSQLTPQQFALFQQIAQLRIVQQGLAQQQLNQKHTISVQAQQQLYQQQQQIALMLAQMQQQLMQQQQPAQANRFPTPGFPHNNVPTQASHANTTGNPQQHKNSKPVDKPSSEAQAVTSESAPEPSQAKDVPVSLPVDERTKQASPAPQSRLTQWKQPLLPNPDQPPTSTEASKEWNTSANTSPKPSRMSESVSSRWGVDASPRLSADPPEFKPGVPWRPRNEDEKISPREEDKTSDKSPSPSSPSKQRGSFNEGAELSGQYTFGIGSSPWQSTGPNDSLLNKTSSLRPPPGLDSQNVFPETSNLEEEHSSWVKNLIDGAPPSFAQNGPTKDFNFGQLSFPIGSSWSTQDGQILTAPDPKPWAAPGGPSSSTTPPSVIPMASSVGQASGTINATPTTDVTKATNTGISSWSANQPIPSAEEKLSHKRPLLGNDPSKSASASLSTWLVLRNIPPNADINAIRNVCQQHGQLLIFQYNMRYGNSLIRYGSKDQAATMRTLLNGMNVQGGQLSADFATDSDIAAFFEQPVDWSSNPLPPNSNYGNHWGTFLMGQGEASQNRPNAVLNQDNKPPQVPPSTVVPPGSMNWGNTGPTPNPSQLWGTPLPGSNTGFPSSQGPSMWSFGGNPPERAPPQSGGDNGGLVSPSMTTFLPPGLLNGGESV